MEFCQATLLHEWELDGTLDDKANNNTLLSNGGKDLWIYDDSSECLKGRQCFHKNQENSNDGFLYSTEDFDSVLAEQGKYK